MSHCTEKHNMDLNAWYKPPNVGFQWGNIILSIGTTLKQIWDHFMIWLHHHNITSKNCKCRTVGQRSSTVQCDIVPPWYLGIILSILIVQLGSNFHSARNNSSRSVGNFRSKSEELSQRKIFSYSWAQTGLATNKIQ